MADESPDLLDQEPAPTHTPQFGYDYANLNPANIGTGDALFRYETANGSVVQREPLNKVLDHYGDDRQNIDKAHEKRAWIPTIGSEAHSLANQPAGATPEDQVIFMNSAVRYSEHTWFDTSLRLNKAIELGETARAEQLASQLNRSMSEIYQLPQRNRAVALLKREASSNPQIQELYSEIGIESTPDLEQVEDFEVKYREEINEIRSVIVDRYGGLIDEFIADDTETYTPTQALVIVNLLIDQLSRTDASVDWSRVQAVLADDEKVFSTSSGNGLVSIKVPGKGKKLGAKEFRGIVSHELLWHAARGANGWAKGKKDTDVGELQGRGMPLYLGFEEGGAIISELAFTGMLDQLFVDRYTDIALAAGVIDGRMRARPELQDFVFRRELARKGLTSIDELSESERTSLHIHVDRIYRGGYGGENPKLTVIYPKDAEYFAGALKFLEWYREQRSQGIDPKDIYDLAREGKNDLTVPEHVAYLEKIKTS